MVVVVFFVVILVDVAEIAVIGRKYRPIVRLARPLHYVTANFSCNVSPGLVYQCDADGYTVSKLKLYQK